MEVALEKYISIIEGKNTRDVRLESVNVCEEVDDEGCQLILVEATIYGDEESNTNLYGVRWDTINNSFNGAYYAPPAEESDEDFHGGAPSFVQCANGKVYTNNYYEGMISDVLGEAETNGGHRDDGDGKGEYILFDCTSYPQFGDFVRNHIDSYISKHTDYYTSAEFDEEGNCKVYLNPDYDDEE